LPYEIFLQVWSFEYEEVKFKSSIEEEKPNIYSHFRFSNRHTGTGF